MNIGVIGAGSWGTCLADLLAKKGFKVKLWAYETDLVDRMNSNYVNDIYLPDIKISKNVTFCNDINKVANCNVLLLVPPSQLMRNILKNIIKAVNKDTIVISASKGIENDTLLPMSEVIRDILPPEMMGQIAYLSGPTFAKEVAQEQPSAVVAASYDYKTSLFIQEIFNTDYFRVYTNDDVVGVELGGALKNVIALAAGICDGLGYGYNTRAALITRGLAEMRKIGVAMGAKAETFSGLAGMGDLLLTCTGDLSRNRSVGINIGKGIELDQILSEMTTVAEGVKTSLASYQLAKKLNVDVPIINEVYNIVYCKKNPRQAVLELMKRDLKSEYI